MILSYFDDSSDERAARYVSIGGIVGSDELVPLFEQMWVRVTNHLAEPFRSTECECQHGQFKHVNKRDRDALMAKLVDLLTHQANLVGKLASVVPVPLYKEVFPNGAESDPLRLAVTHIIVQMANEGRQQNMPVKLCFEDSTKDRPLIERVYRELNRLQSLRIGGWLSEISFSGKRCPSLQAADLVAREAFKASDNLGTRPYRIPLKRMWDTSGFILWGRDGLESLKRNGWPSNLAAILTLPPETDFRQRPRDGSSLFSKK
jgi:hypothetical protein